MAKIKNFNSEFNLVGELIKTSTKKGKIKYLKLATEDGKYWVKITRQARENLNQDLPKGCQLQVAGKQKQHPKTGKLKFKAQTVKIISDPASQLETKIKTETVSLLPIFETEHKSKAKVLICQKSNCWKKGGKEVCEQLEKMLSDRGLDRVIPIKKTGCLKKCKQAPNLVMMPDKVRHTKVRPKQIPALVEKHLLAKK